MSFQQRSYSSKIFRPKPVVDFDSLTGTTLVVTSWGSPELAGQAIKTFKDFLSLSSEDNATRIGAQSESLGSIGNRLRSAALLINEQIYTQENNREYLEGIELAAVSVQENLLSWVQIGSPHILVSSPKGLQPICYTPGFTQSAPLVSLGLGLEKVPQLNCGSFSLNKSSNEKILFLARTEIPPALYALKSADINLASQVLCSDDPEMPFWCGIP